MDLAGPRLSGYTNRECSTTALPSFFRSLTLTNFRYSPRKVLQAIESVMQAKPQPFAGADDQSPPVSKATPPTNPTNDSAPPASGTHGNKVLIVDDNEINLKVT
jgi:hypothetical protein